MNEETPKVQPEKPAFDEKKKNALLRYVAILFAAAFLVVLLSMVSQMRDSRHTITQLNQSSTSSLQKAEQLQDTNRLLEENNELLKGEIADLNEDVTVLQTRIGELELELEKAQEVHTDLAGQQTEELDAVRKAYELLLQYEAAPTEDNAEKLEAYKSYLGPQGLETYETILAMEKGVENND